MPCLNISRQKRDDANGACLAQEAGGKHMSTLASLQYKSKLRRVRVPQGNPQ